MKILNSEIKTVRNWLLLGSICGAVIGTIEYFLRLNADTPHHYVPLVTRSTIVGALILGSMIIFESSSKNRFAKKTFAQLVLIKSLCYTLIISFWLMIMNAFWLVIALDDITYYKFWQYYLGEKIFLINLITVGSGALVLSAIIQINSLHRKGELVNFVLGRYHTPREVKRIFCFIDLKSSTQIAEKLGHYRFAMFLKDYYSDITEALRKTNAQIYQYVGDEIVLSWSFENGLRNNNLIECYFQMKEIIKGKEQYYMNKYGFLPVFKAGMHGGQVIVTWVGEIKKEIVYIGDVLNTAARLQEDCNRLNKNFLISGELLTKIDNLGRITASFVEETIPRGKENQIQIYSLELTSDSPS